MAIKTLFIPLDQAESTSETQNNKDKYDRFKEKTKKFDSRQRSKARSQKLNSIVFLPRASRG